MSGEWVVPAIVLALGALFIYLVVNYLVGHPFVSGVLVGLIAGTGVTIIAYRAGRWLKNRRFFVKVEPPEK
jgi:hypothetical protein